MLAPGGMLVYSTCTFSPEEDEGSLQYILDNYPDMHVVKPELAYEGFSGGRPEWIENGKKALLIDGARQVGKTYIIRHCLTIREI